jgi:hypothetical protein
MLSFLPSILAEQACFDAFFLFQNEQSDFSFQKTKATD